MIVCQCGVISCRQIRDSVAEMRDGDPYCIVTPGRVFKKCGARPNCGNCMSLFVATIETQLGDKETARAKTRFIDKSGASGLEKVEITSGMTGWSGANSSSLACESNDESKESQDEGQREGHRVSKQGTAS